jgi:Asp-tRNA(Asn)/Glu-tRNA(Gln) amidotransferase A subunit family amidase
MGTRAELELLDYLEDGAESMADEAELTGLARREFVFLSLIGAAASTFGFGARAMAQASAPAGGQAPQSPPPPPLGNGEPVSWTFQPYPGGTGALMEKLVRERGPNAFRRSAFGVQRWNAPVPNAAEDIAFLPAHRLSALIRERKLTSTQVTRIYLDRLERLDPTLLCAVTIMKEQALAEAARADEEIRAGKYRGPLHGIPYGVKDLFSTKGTRTTWGSADFEQRTIDEDAEVIVRLRDAGAVLMAKLSTGLFALGDQWYRGRTNNPWDIRRGSSGSSAGPASATAAGCVAFAIGTETSGSIVSPARECGVSALRPTFGRVSRHGGMVLAWSQDRVGPICRTVEDCAMVFHAIHGVDVKDPSTVTMPFAYNRNIRLAALRIAVDTNAPKELVDKLRELGAVPKPIGPRPQLQGGGALGAESAAAFDSYVQWKAKELGIDLASIPEPVRGAGGGGGGGGGGPVADTTRRAGADTTRGRAAAPAALSGRPTGMAAITRWTNGRFPRAFDFVQAQRRRYILITQMAELLKDVDMYVPGGSGQGQWDVGLHAQTGHPCVVVPYKFEPPTTVPPGTPQPDSTAARVTYNPKPICAVLAGNLYNDDLILSVAHRYQAATDWHLKRPSI